MIPEPATCSALGRLAGMVSGPVVIAAMVGLALAEALPSWGLFVLGVAGGALLRLLRPLTWYRLARYGPRLVTGRGLGRCWPCHVADRSRRWCCLRFTIAPDSRHGRGWGEW